MRGIKMITRDYAMVNRLKIYYDCSSCKKGHPPGRYTKTGRCVYCHRENAKSDNPDRITKKKLKTAYGVLKVYMYVHSEDLPLLEAFAASLRLDRGIILDL
jgi:hypothetical protein